MEELKRYVGESVQSAAELNRYFCFIGREKKQKRKSPPLEQEIDDLEKLHRQEHIDRLNCGSCTPRSGTVFIEILSNLERVADHSTNVAYSVLEDS